MAIQRIHHVAYRCKDALETVKWYEKYMGMTYQLAFAENRVPSTQEPDPYMHVFLDCGNGNVLAFFELPTKPDMGRDENTPAWVQHIAFEVESMDELLAAKAKLEADGIEVVGPTDHTMFESIYFFDPNGQMLHVGSNQGLNQSIWTSGLSSSSSHLWGASFSLSERRTCLPLMWQYQDLRARL